jgi:hypothetical protein
MKITITELKSLCNLLLDRVSKIGGKEITFDKDWYWTIDISDRYVNQPPVLVGSLADDLEGIKQLLNDPDYVPSPLDLERLGQIFGKNTKWSQYLIIMSASILALTSVQFLEQMEEIIEISSEELSRLFDTAQIIKKILLGGATLIITAFIQQFMCEPPLWTERSILFIFFAEFFIIFNSQVSQMRENGVKLTHDCFTYCDEQ